MNEELEKYTLELGEVQRAIGQVEGMIHTKEENVKELQAQLDDLIGVREQIEDKIAEREKEEKEAENRPEIDSKEPEELKEIEEYKKLEKECNLKTYPMKVYVSFYSKPIFNIRNIHVFFKWCKNFIISVVPKLLFLKKNR